MLYASSKYSDQDRSAPKKEKTAIEALEEDTKKLGKKKIERNREDVEDLWSWRCLTFVILVYNSNTELLLSWSLYNRWRNLRSHYELPLWRYLWMWPWTFRHISQSSSAKYHKKHTAHQKIYSRTSDIKKNFFFQLMAIIKTSQAVSNIQKFSAPLHNSLPT